MTVTELIVILFGVIMYWLLLPKIGRWLAKILGTLIQGHAGFQRFYYDLSNSHRLDSWKRDRSRFH